MTTRDRFACAAMQSLLPTVSINRDAMRQIAQTSYLVAEAMMAVKRKIEMSESEEEDGIFHVPIEANDTLVNDD